MTLTINEFHSQINELKNNINTKHDEIKTISNNNKKLQKCLDVINNTNAHIESIVEVKNSRAKSLFKSLALITGTSLGFIVLGILEFAYILFTPRNSRPNPFNPIYKKLVCNEVFGAYLLANSFRNESSLTSHIDADIKLAAHIQKKLPKFIKLSNTIEQNCKAIKQDIEAIDKLDATVGTHNNTFSAIKLDPMKWRFFKKVNKLQIKIKSFEETQGKIGHL